MNALGRAAIAYAHRLGWRILPCEPGGKRAILKDWPARATTDPATIRSWWDRTAANIAVATGPASGILGRAFTSPAREAAIISDIKAGMTVRQNYGQAVLQSGPGGAVAEVDGCLDVRWLRE